MSFNSYLFVLAFLPLTWGGYFILNKFNRFLLADLFLIGASLLFYGHYNKKYILFLLASVLINYGIAQLLHRNTGSRKIWFIIGLILDIGSLFILKYYNFFISNINSNTKIFIPLLQLILPIGISFYTFQQISYITDCYMDPESGRYSFLSYMKYSTFFPYLLEGPIAYHWEIIPQLNKSSRRNVNFDNLAKGLWLFSIGMGKKVIIADVLGLLVDDSFSHIADLDTLKCCIVMLSYTLQIYFDFSGYCDMASGVAKMFNIDLPVNFNSPYKALTISDFWKRWHITLTRFFTKYIYIPLGGNRKGEIRTYINMIIVFLISGLWHGANWTFVIWGLAHGIASAFTRLLQTRTKLLTTELSQLKKAFLWLATFLFVNLAWVMFRADSVSTALAFYKKLFSFRFCQINDDFRQLVVTDFIKLLKSFMPIGRYQLLHNWLWFLLVIAFSLAVILKNQITNIDNWKPTMIKMLFTVILLVFCIMSFSNVSSFIYWNF